MSPWVTSTGGGGLRREVRVRLGLKQNLQPRGADEPSAVDANDAALELSVRVGSGVRNIPSQEKDTMNVVSSGSGKKELSSGQSDSGIGRKRTREREGTHHHISTMAACAVAASEAPARTSADVRMAVSVSCRDTRRMKEWTGGINREGRGRGGAVRCPSEQSYKRQIGGRATSL